VSKVRCPYCFATFRRAATLFRCLAVRPGLATGSPCERKVDKRLEAYIGAAGPATLGPTFAADGRKLSAVCPDCGWDTAKRVCPECHNELPAHFGDIDSAMVGLVGPTTAGKTVYITVLVHELRNRVGEAFGAAVDPMDDRTIRKYRHEFEARLYGQGVVLPPTQLGAADRNYPLLYRLTSKRRYLWGSRSRSTSLVLFDTAGESFQTRDSVDIHVRYVSAADGLIVMVDPLQIDEIRQRVDGAAQLPVKGDPPDQVLNNVTNQIRASRGLRADRKISTPVAVVLSKVDMLWDQLPEMSPLRRESNHAGFFDEADRRELHDEIRALLKRWEGGLLDRHLQHNYDRYSYFGMSSLGAAADSARIDRDLISPFRVEDCVLWLLSHVGVVETRRPAQ
jgi:Double-GTPase 2